MKIKFLKLIIITVLVLVLTPISADAFFEKLDQDYSVSAEEIVKGDIIKIGKKITIDGVVDGDVVVIGSDLTVSGRVSGDVIAFASTINLTGDIDGNIRVAGSDVVINSKVGRNINAFGTTITLGKDSIVGRSAYLYSSTIKAAGKVNKNLVASANRASVENTVGQDLSLRLEGPGALTLLPEAQVGGKLHYEALNSNQLVLSEGVKLAGEPEYQEIIPSGKSQFRKKLDAAYLFGRIISLFGLLVIGLVLVSLMPKKIIDIYAEMKKKPLLALGWGFMWAMLLPLACIILSLTIIGIPLAILLTVIYLMALYVSQAIAGISIGLLIFNYISKGAYAKSLIWPMVTGLALLIFISNLFIIGFAVKVLVIFWTLGATIKVMQGTIKEWQ